MKGKRISFVTSLFFVTLLIVSCIETCQSLVSRRSCPSITAVRPLPTTTRLLKQLEIRGGSDYDEEEDEESDSESIAEEIEDGAATVMSTVNSITKRFVIVLGKALVAGTKASGRAVKAAFQGDDDVEEDEEPPSFMTRMMRTAKRMWVAAWDTSDAGDDESSADLASTVKKKSKKKEANVEAEDERVSMSDFGSFLEESYSVSVDRGDDPTIVMGGTIGDALREARSKARLVVVFIPSARPGRGKKKTPDHEAIESLLSPEVSEVAEKRARKKQDSGSFVLWSAKASSPEAITAIKRLKAKQSSSKGDKRPVLVVAYPAQVSKHCVVAALTRRNHLLT
jgi:hypothetical protein